jgi:radical SAM protein with 4Fe4S-binding SPASM domain
MKFSLNEKILFPTKIIIQKFGSRFLIFAYEVPTWIVLSEKELFFFHLLKKRSLRSAMIAYSNHFSVSESSVLFATKRFLLKIQNASFFSSSVGESEDPIGNVPKNIQINLTNACNFHCSHCYLSAGTGKLYFLDKEKIFSAIDKISKTSLIDSIVVSGGEPLLFPDLVAVLKKLSAYHLVLFTNGSLLSDENAPTLLSYVDEVQISLEGITKPFFESVRGKGNYERIIRAIDLVKKSGKKLTLAITILPSTLEDVKTNLLPFVRSLKYDKIEIRLNNDIERAGNALGLDLDHSNQLASDKIVLSLYRQLQKSGYTSSAKDERCKRFLNCGIGASIVINYDGFIYPCNKFSPCRFPLDGDVPLAIRSFNSINEATAVNQIKKCSRCKLRYVCCGMCKIDNLQKNGSLTKPLCTRLTRRKTLYSLLRFSL